MFGGRGVCSGDPLTGGWTLTWVPETAPPERLAIARAPGSAPGVPLAQDLAALRAAGIRHVICLLEDSEFLHLPGDWLAGSWSAAVEAGGFALHRIPVEDYTAPTRAQVVRLLRLVGDALGRDEGV
jgi:hypothetical protein